MENNLKTVTSSSGPALLQGQPGTSEDASPLERCDMTNGTNGSENGWVMVSYTSQIHPNSSKFPGKTWINFGIMIDQWVYGYPFVRQIPMILCNVQAVEHVPHHSLFGLRPCWLHWSEAQQSDSLSEQYEQRVQDTDDVRWYSARMSFCCWRFHLSQHKCSLLHLHRSTFSDINKCVFMHYMYILIYCFNSVLQYIVVIQSYIYIYNIIM